MSEDLQTLGAGNGSSNEAIKLKSELLRGTLASALTDGQAKLDEESVQLLKFHGSYQEDDRDQRRDRREAGLDKAYEFMVRSRIPGGVLTAAQYLAHDELAERYGNGSLRLTTRQGIQLHGVLKGDLVATIRRINDVLLSTLAACGDVNRNVMTCPAPIGAHAAQLQQFAHQIAMRLAPQTRAYHEIWLGGEKVTWPETEPLYGETYLPRKFKIGIAPPGDNCVDVLTQDIGMIAEIANDRLRGFTVLVGGGMGSTHGKAETFPRLATPLCFTSTDDVIEVVEAIVMVYRDYGDRRNRKHARMKYLVEERGIDWFRNEVECRLKTHLEEPRPFLFDVADDHLGWQQQSDGQWALGVHIDCGRVVDRVTELTRSGLRHTIGSIFPGIRITGQQNLLLTDISESSRERVDEILHGHGIETRPERLGIRRAALACPALPTCGLAVAEAERALPDVLSAIEYELALMGLGPDSLSIRMTGCPNGCARPRMGDIGIVGRSLDLYDVYVGGDLQNTRLNYLYAEGVKRGAIAKTLAPALAQWKTARRSGEGFGDFAYRHQLTSQQDPC